MKTIQVEIVSAEDQVFSGQATMIVVAGIQGDLGITPRHAPLLTLLQPGPVRVIKESGEEELVYVSGGILEVQPSVVTILADTVVRAHDFDEAKALEAKAHAESLLQTEKADFDYSLARAELARAAGLLRAIKQLRKELQ